MIIDINFFNSQNINIHDVYEINHNLFKVDLSQDKLKPIMLKLEDLNVISITDSQLILSLKGKENIKTIFDNLDSYIVCNIQERKIAKKLKTKFNYRQLISSYVNKDNSIDILSLNLNFNDNNFKTDIYQKSTKKINKDDALHLMKDNCKVDIILEIVGITFDKQEGFIYLENLVRQLKVKKIKPKRVEHLEYLFVDSDDSKSEVNDSKSEVNDDSKSEVNDDCLVDTHKVLNYSNDVSDIKSDNESDIELDIRQNMDSETSHGF